MRRPYDDDRLSGQGRRGVVQWYVDVLSHIDGEESTEGVEEATMVRIWAWPPRSGDEDDRDAVGSSCRSVNPSLRIVLGANRPVSSLRRRHLRPPSRIRSDELFVRHVRSDRGLLL